jgi:hypothetical protein
VLAEDGRAEDDRGDRFDGVDDGQGRDSGPAVKALWPNRALSRPAAIRA